MSLASERQLQERAEELLHRHAIPRQLGNPETTTLADARAWLRERVEDGEKCPCCQQMAKIYRRKLNRSMVAVLRALYEAGGTTKFVHAAEVCRERGLRQQGDAGKLALFRLAVEDPRSREDGGQSGYWMVTEEGVEFLRGRYRLPKYARVYDDRVLGYSGSPVGIADVAPEFRFDELMRGE